MANRDKSIRVRVTPDEKSEFEEYVEESREFNSLSDFLRGSAYREMSDTDDGSVDTDELVSVVESSFQDVTDDIDEIRRGLSVVKDNVLEDDEAQNLAAELYDALPIHEDRSGFEWPWPDADSRMENGIHIIERGSVDSIQDARAWSDAEAWAEYFDESIERTQRALSLCLSQYPDVAVAEEEEPVSDHDLRRYYRKEV